MIISSFESFLNFQIYFHYMYTPSTRLCRGNARLYESAPDLLCQEYQHMDQGMQQMSRTRFLFSFYLLCYI